MRRILLLLPILVFVSCATLVSGKHENISVESSPEGAEATLTCTRGEVRGRTPMTVPIRRDAGDCLLKISKEGYAEQTVLLEQGINPAYWGNFVFSPFVPFAALALSGGFFGEAMTSDKQMGAAGLVTAGMVWFVDKWTGAMRRHEPRTVKVALVPRKGDG